MKLKSFFFLFSIQYWSICCHYVVIHLNSSIFCAHLRRTLTWESINENYAQINLETLRIENYTSVHPTNMLFPVSLLPAPCVCECVCYRGPLKVCSSVLLMCFMSQGRALAWPKDSPPLSVWCGLIPVRGLYGRAYGITPCSMWSIHFDFAQWCNADERTGENVTITACVCAHYSIVCVSEDACAYVVLRVCVHTYLCGLSMHPLYIASNMYYAHL